MKEPAIEQPVPNKTRKEMKRKKNEQIHIDLQRIEGLKINEKGANGMKIVHKDTEKAPMYTQPTCNQNMPYENSIASVDKIVENINSVFWFFLQSLQRWKDI